MGLGVHRFTPELRLLVQIFQVSELAAGEEVLFHIPDQTLYFPLSLRLPDPTDLWQKAHLYRKVRELGIPNHLASLTPCDNCLHVVGQDFLRHTPEIQKCVQHTPFHATQVTAAYKLNVLGTGIS